MNITTKVGSTSDENLSLNSLLPSAIVPALNSCNQSSSPILRHKYRDIQSITDGAKSLSETLSLIPSNDTLIISSPILTTNRLILVAEDNNFVRVLMNRTLNQLNYNCFCVEDGQKAVEYASLHYGEIFLCIFDMIMPNLGGIEALSKLRSTGFVIPTIGLTGDDSDDCRSKFNHAGAFSVLTKPVRSDELKLVIDSVLLPNGQKKC